MAPWPLPGTPSSFQKALQETPRHPHRCHLFLALVATGHRKNMARVFVCLRHHQLCQGSDTCSRHSPYPCAHRPPRTHLPTHPSRPRAFTRASDASSPTCVQWPLLLFKLAISWLPFAKLEVTRIGTLEPRPNTWGSECVGYIWIFPPSWILFLASKVV